MGTFLSQNIRQIVHLRKRLHRDRMLGLCLGAGVSADFKFPSWPDLIRRIAGHAEIQGLGLLNVSESLTSQSQFLFEKYTQGLRKSDSATVDDILESRRAKTGWLQIVHESLYRAAVIDDSKLREHPYLWDLIPLVKESAMTVNYNFDDTVERMLYAYYADDIRRSDDRGFEVVWQPSTQFRRQKGVIYHPNGFLPLSTSDGLSDQIVFMEEEFADQLIDVGSGHYSCLLNHFTKHTLIFVGLSLSDGTLKHILRVAARITPGHFHFHIHWCRDKKPSLEEQNAIRHANFDVYNLVTLFFTTQEIQEFSRILLEDTEAFNARCDRELAGVRTEYRYYLTGSVGSGKTTTVDLIRGLECFDEWVDRKHSLLHKPHEELLPDQRTQLDDWINQQFRKKNRRVSQASHAIALVDRSPLDPLYFTTDDAAERTRAGELIQWMVPGQGPIKRIAPGHLFVFTCDVAVLRTRLASRAKLYNDDQLRKQQEKIEKFWKNHSHTLIDTTNMAVSQVVKRILKEILFEEYREIEFHDVCQLRNRVT